MIKIRKGTLADIDAMMDCYDIARKFMRASGNMTQWGNGYPSARTNRRGYCQRRQSCWHRPGRKHRYGVRVYHREDPTYALIEDGEWLNPLLMAQFTVSHRQANTKEFLIRVSNTARH